jgi:hypothetical protein
MSKSPNGFLEKISWQAILGAIVVALTLFFAFPDYLLNIRPRITEIIGAGTLSFIEGAIFGTVVTLLVLKFISDRSKREENKEK